MESNHSSTHPRPVFLSNYTPEDGGGQSNSVNQIIEEENRRRRMDGDRLKRALQQIDSVVDDKHPMMFAVLQIVGKYEIWGRHEEIVAALSERIQTAPENARMGVWKAVDIIAAHLPSLAPAMCNMITSLANYLPGTTRDTLIRKGILSSGQTEPDPSTSNRSKLNSPDLTDSGSDSIDSRPAIKGANAFEQRHFGAVQQTEQADATRISGQGLSSSFELGQHFEEEAFSSSSETNHRRRGRGRLERTQARSRSSSVVRVEDHRRETNGRELRHQSHIVEKAIGRRRSRSEPHTEDASREVAAVHHHESPSRDTRNTINACPTGINKILELSKPFADRAQADQPEVIQRQSTGFRNTYRPKSNLDAKITKRIQVINDANAVLKRRRVEESSTPNPGVLGGAPPHTSLPPRRSPMVKDRPTEMYAPGDIRRQPGFVSRPTTVATDRTSNLIALSDRFERDAHSQSATIPTIAPPRRQSPPPPPRREFGNLASSSSTVSSFARSSRQDTSLDRGPYRRPSSQSRQSPPRRTPPFDRPRRSSPNQQTRIVHPERRDLGRRSPSRHDRMEPSRDFPHQKSALSGAPRDDVKPSTPTYHFQFRRTSDEPWERSSGFNNATDNNVRRFPRPGEDRPSEPRAEVQYEFCRQRTQSSDASRVRPPSPPRSWTSTLASRKQEAPSNQRSLEDRRTSLADRFGVNRRRDSYQYEGSRHTESRVKEFHR